MKIALLFLSALVVMTHQQFQRQNGMRWMPYSQQRVLGNYYQPPYYDAIDEDDTALYRQFRPSRPASYYQNDDFDPNNVAGLDGQDESEGDNYEDIQSRIKINGRYRPSFMKQNPRLFFNYMTGTSIVNPLQRTLRITVTSTVNITSVQSCISSSLFSNAAAQNNNCRRRRDVIDLLEEDDQEDTQFFISPTETQQLTPSALPSMDLVREKRQLPADLASSLDESNIEEAIKQSNTRDKRFLIPYTYSTITSYTFVSTTITKAVNIASSAATGPLLCKPAGYVIC